MQGNSLIAMSCPSPNKDKKIAYSIHVNQLYDPSSYRLQ